jgi:hypothetical protein
MTVRLLFVAMALATFPSCAAFSTDPETGVASVDLVELRADLRLARQEIAVLRDSVDLPERWEELATRAEGALAVVEEALASAEAGDLWVAAEAALDVLAAAAAELAGEEDAAELRAAVGVARALLLAVERYAGRV